MRHAFPKVAAGPPSWVCAQSRLVLGMGSAVPPARMPLSWLRAQHLGISQRALQKLPILAQLTSLPGKGLSHLCWFIVNGVSSRPEVHRVV